MTAVCPMCGQRLTTRLGIFLPPRLVELFDLVERAGRRGVPCETLAWIFYPGKPTLAAKRCVAVHVSRLNDFLQPTDTRIRGGRWQPYRIVTVSQRIAA
jgi:hypothetical protein